MKKVLSIFMTGLLVLLNFSVKGCEVQNLSDGGKKVIYRYNELDDLIKVHYEAKNELEFLIKNKTKRHDTIEKISIPMSLSCMLAGAVLFGAGLNKNRDINKKSKKSKIAKIVSGATLFGAGLTSLVGIPMGLNSSIDNLIDQKYAIEERILEINAIKESIGGYISKQIVTNLDVERKFYYSLFVDKKGFVYKMEWCNAGLYSNAVLFETKYKLNVD